MCVFGTPRHEVCTSHSLIVWCSGVPAPSTPKRPVGSTQLRATAQAFVPRFAASPPAAPPPPPQQQQPSRDLRRYLLACMCARDYGFLVIPLPRSQFFGGKATGSHTNHCVS